MDVRRVMGICVAVLGLSGLGLSLIGCGAQSENFDDKDWTKQHGIQTAPWREVESMFSDQESNADQFKFSLEGVRHDLTLGPDAKPTTRCTCLDVAIGTAGDRRFVWAGKRPKVAGKDMVVALRTEGSNCPNGPDKRRPSIQGVDTRGDDVTIIIEELKLDRPQALGAIIVKPGAQGRLYVRAANTKRTKLPYARAKSGANVCYIETDPRLHHQQVRAGRRF
jgi:hypothetical protein